jgi:hypothetical protein
MRSHQRSSAPISTSHQHRQSAPAISGHQH